MEKLFRLAALALVLALLGQPVAVVAECMSMPAKECPSPAAPVKAPAATVELTAAVLPLEATGHAPAPAASLPGWGYHDPPRLLDSSPTQALLGVFLI